MGEWMLEQQGKGRTSNEGHNEYTADLVALESRVSPAQSTVPPLLSTVLTPVKIPIWEVRLAGHPDRKFVEYVINGLRSGFKIGYDYASTRRSATRNMKSAMELAHIVDENLGREVAAKRLLGPLTRDSLPAVHISPFGVIPKSQPGKWRTILDLSSPHGQSVNDGIDKELCSLRYIRVNDITDKLSTIGPGTQMTKVDIESAHRLVPVHPNDRHLLGMEWRGSIYIDTMLPFGLRSAPKVFNAVADAIEWMLKAKGVTHLAHYLDDFILIGKAGTSECQRNLQAVLEECAALRVPLARHKLRPGTCLVFLGIVLDTVKMEIRLPAEKLRGLRRLIKSWRCRRVCTRRELESLAGHLCHACKVVRPGRRFLRGIFQLISRFSKPHFKIRLNSEFRADLEWWHSFIQDWNGVSMLYKTSIQTPDVQVWSDASGAWGCAAIHHHQWFQIRWSDYPEFQDVSIAAKELLPIVVAATVWGNRWSRSTVCFHCDNQAVVDVIRGGYCKDKYLAHMLRCMFFLEAHFAFTATARHIPGIENTQADALSRNNYAEFAVLAPQARNTSAKIPPELVRGLTTQAPWTSANWETWFSTICKRH